MSQLYNFDEPFEVQYIRGIDNPNNVVIPFFDCTAYSLYPRYRWVYNKLRLSEAQGLFAVPHGADIDDIRFPLFSKPITNLYGMSQGACIIEQWNDKEYTAGHFLMSILEGQQYSIDVVVNRGKILWECCFLSLKDANGSFTCFTKTPCVPHVQHEVIESWVTEYFADFKGVLNFEFINEYIIECHLRMSSQFMSLNGRGWLQAVVDLYQPSGVWRFDNTETEKTGGYSLPLRVENSGYYSFMEYSQQEALKYANCVFILCNDWTNVADCSNDNHSYLLACVNAFELNDAQYALQALQDGLIFSDKPF